VLGEAVSGAKSTADDKVADYLRTHEFKTIMGSWRYGPNGERTKSGFLEVQYHDIKEGAGLETWRGMKLSNRIHTAGTQDRQRDLPVREGEVANTVPASSDPHDIMRCVRSRVPAG